MIEPIVYGVQIVLSNYSYNATVVHCDNAVVQVKGMNPSKACGSSC